MTNYNNECLPVLLASTCVMTSSLTFFR